MTMVARILMIVFLLGLAAGDAAHAAAPLGMQIAMSDHTADAMEDCSACASDSSQKQAICDLVCNAPAIGMMPREAAVWSDQGRIDVPQPANNAMAGIENGPTPSPPRTIILV